MLHRLKVVGRTTARWAFLVAVSLTCGCGGGGGGGVIQACLDFLAGSSPTAGMVTAQEASGSACDPVAVDVLVTDVSDIFAASFTITYDPSVARYEMLSTSGSVLGCGGTTIQALEDKQSGQATIGLTRQGAATGCDAVGSGLLVRLFFSKVGTSGSSNLTFSNTKLFGSETPPQEKPGIMWSGGTFEIR